MSLTTVTAKYSESSGAGTLTVQAGGGAVVTNTLYYVNLVGATVSGGSVYSSTSWAITWEQNTSTVGYANGVAPVIPSEIYVGEYEPTYKTYNDVYNFILKPNGIWTLTFVKSSTTDSSNHPQSLFFVGYDNVNNLTYTKQVTFSI